MNAQVQFSFYIMASFGGNNDALVFLPLGENCIVASWLLFYVFTLCSLVYCQSSVPQPYWVCIPLSLILISNYNSRGFKVLKLWLLLHMIGYFLSPCSLF